MSGTMLRLALAATIILVGLSPDLIHLLGPLRPVVIMTAILALVCSEYLGWHLAGRH